MERPLSPFMFPTWYRFQITSALSILHRLTGIALAVGSILNIYIDLSGWSPKYFPTILVQYCNTLLKKKVLFGSDWPMISPERWLSDFDKIEIKDEVRPLILKENAVRLLKLA